MQLQPFEAQHGISGIDQQRKRVKRAVAKCRSLSFSNPTEQKTDSALGTYDLLVSLDDGPTAHECPLILLYCSE